MERFGDFQGGDVDLDLLRNVAGLALHRQRACDLLQDAAGRHAFGLAAEDDRYVHHHVLVHAHFQEVRVEHVAVDRVLLEVLEEHRARLAAVDLQLDHRVELVRSGDGLLDRLRIHRHVERLLVRAVADGGDQALAPQAVRGALARLVALLGGERADVIRHDFSFVSGLRRRAGRARAWD